MDLLTLVEQDTKATFRKAAIGARGVEWHGPCPMSACGGTNRFHVWTETPTKDNYWCRSCGATGDLLQYLRDARGMDWWDAVQASRGSIVPLGSPVDATPPAPRVCEAPSVAWQCSAYAWLERCQVALWDFARPRSLAWLGTRGLSLETVAGAGLGVNAAELRVPVQEWGLDGEGAIWLPRGIVFPWFVDGQLWKLCIRRPNADLRNADDPKYITVKGSANALFGADQLAPGRPAVLVEGVIDALAVQQAAGDLVAAVASGTTGARELVWSVRLKAASRVLVALDADQAGDEHSPYWVDLLGARASRWRPLLNDPGAMAEAGLDLRAWVVAGLETERSAA